MGASAHDVLQSLGDALAGVDRNTEFLKGEQLGADVNLKGSETEAAMALARQRRIDAEAAAAKKARDDAIAGTPNADLNDPERAPIGTMIAAGHGADYAGVQQGRLHGQEYGERQKIATPAPIGDVAAESAREASMDAIAPASAIAARSDRGAPVVALDKDGNPIYVTPKAATRDRMSPGAKPATTQPTNQQKNIEYLKSLGVDENRAVALNFPERDKDTPDELYNAVVKELMHDPVLSDPAKADAAARKAVSIKFGTNAAALLGEHSPIVPTKPQPGAEALPEGLPPGSKQIGQTREGHAVYETPSGKRIVAE